MLIVFVVEHYNAKSDGTCITAQRYESELIKQGHTVRIVSYDVSGENRFALKERRLPIVSTIAKKQNIVFAKYDEDVLRQAFDGADIVHIFLPLNVGRKALKLARKMNLPVTTAFHVHPDNITKNSGIKRLPRFIESFVFWYWRKGFYDKVNHIHCPSQFTANELKKHNYRAKLHVISNGITDKFRPSGEKASFSFEEGKNFEILMVGRFACEKRQDILIDAVKRSKYKDIINITFAGRGPQLEKLERAGENLPNKPSFAFLTQEELLEKIHSAHLYIHSADVEIEGMSCMEAFACGLTPVIGDSKKSATRQFIIDDRCRFKAGDADSLRERIEYWIEHPTELAEMGRMYAQYASGYSVENSVRQFTGMLQQEICDNLRESEAKA